MTTAVKGAARDWQALYKKADAAGKVEAEGAKPTPMYVGTPKDLVGSLLGGDGGGFDRSKPVYYVNDGVCGFAWVKLRPATSSFARWLKKKDLGSSAYRGGLQIWVHGYGQSYERKIAYARGFARVLTEAGFDAYAEGRLD